MPHEISTTIPPWMFVATARRDLLSPRKNLLRLGAIAVILAMLAWGAEASPSRLLLLGLIGLAFYAFLLLLTYWRMRKRILQQRSQTTGEVTYRLNAEGLALADESGEALISWGRFRKLECLRDMWLLHLGRGMSLIVPTADLPDNEREFLLQKLRESGVAIR